MIGLRILWATFMSGILGFAFYRSWQWEHGKHQERITLFDKKNSKDTMVWLPADFLLWVIIITGVMVVILRGEEGLHIFSAFSLDVMFLLSGYFGLLLILLPLLRKKFSARACATLWIAPVFMFYQIGAWIRNIPLPRLTIYLPRPALNILLWIWLAGFIVVEGYYLITHWRFVHRIKENSSPVMDGNILKLWQQIAEELEYRKEVEILRSKATQTPFSMGRTNWNRRTVLPFQDYTAEELSMIFRHEIHHLQRWDVNTKIFITFCRALCWWNPLVWIATKKAAEDLELSCDEIVTENMGHEERRIYAKLLLNSAASQQGFTTCLSAAAETLRYRLKHIINIRPKATGTLLVMASLFTCIMCFGVLALADARDSYTNLLLPEEVEIQGIHFYDPHHSGEVYKWDEESLRQALHRVTVEHLPSYRDHIQTGVPHLELVITRDGKTHFINLTDDTVKDLRLGKNMENSLYLVKSTVDWDAIRAALDFDAPEPVRLNPPEMYYSFSGKGYHDAQRFYALRTSAAAWDGDTGAELRRWDEHLSEPGGGIWGVEVSSVTMDFSRAPVQLEVEVENWDRTDSDTISFDALSTTVTMPLPDYAAHYTVYAEFFYDGIRYTAQYVFDIRPDPNE